jgi:hypothetical protein
MDRGEYLVSGYSSLLCCCLMFASYCDYFGVRRLAAKRHKWRTQKRGGCRWGIFGFRLFPDLLCLEFGVGGRPQKGAYDAKPERAQKKGRFTRSSGVSPQGQNWDFGGGDS